MPTIACGGIILTFVYVAQYANPVFINCAHNIYLRCNRINLTANPHLSNGIVVST